MHNSLKHFTIAAGILMFFATDANAQLPVDVKPEKQHQNPYPMDKASIGLGIGLNYGGAGVNVAFYPQENIGIFAGGGYAIAGFGYNVGIKPRIKFSNKKPTVSLYGLAMYGYNAAFKIKGASNLDKIFYGPSVGIGMETAVKKNKAGVWSFALIFPIRSKAAMDYQDDLMHSPYIKMDNELPPVAISVGYHFIIK